MANTIPERLDLLERILRRGFDDYVSQGVITALLNYIRFLQDQITAGGGGISLPDGTIPQVVGGMLVASSLTELTDIINSLKSIATPPGSIQIGDSRVSSGGRMISAMSSSTGNLGALLIQVFNDMQYSPATVYDPTQVAVMTDLQGTAENLQSVSGTTYNIQYILQATGQLQSVVIKPVGGAITEDITYTVRLASGSRPIYSEILTLSDFTDIGNGEFQAMLANPSQADIGTTVFIQFEGQPVLGGAFDGTDGVRTGDPTNGNFFPYLRTMFIPIVRLAIATEQYVNNIIGQGFTIHDFSINTPGRVDIGTNLGSRIIQYTISNITTVTTLALQINGTDFVQLTPLPTTDGTYTNTVDLSTVDTSTATNLVFRVQANDLINSNTQTTRVAAPVVHERLYWNVETNSDPAAFDYTVALSKDGTSGEITLPTFTNTAYIKIAYPGTDPDITELLIGSLNQLSAFTLTRDAITINSVLYDVLVSNNAVLGSVLSGEVITIIR